ncbi:MAG: ABC transporter substrate-binding protein, partial [Anaerolineae bacterium]
MEKMLTRRSLLRCIGLAGGAAVLAACVPATPQVVEKVVKETVVVEVAAPTKAPVAVKLVHWQHHSPSRAQTVEHFKARFEDENPGITIDFQSIPWNDYWGKLASGIAAGKGSAPDVFQIPMGLVEEYVAGGNLIPTADVVITAQEIEENYLPWTVQRGKKEGQYYGLPLDVQTLLIYRNEALFQEVGLDSRADFTDLNDCYDQAMQLTKKANGVTDQIGCNTGYYCAWMTVLFQQ